MFEPAKSTLRKPLTKAGLRTDPNSHSAMKKKLTIELQRAAGIAPSCPASTDDGIWRLAGNDAYSNYNVPTDWRVARTGGETPNRNVGCCFIRPG